jgi:protein-tyrosine-phosphatase
MKKLEPAVQVLFVCMGNICRSPTAEGVFRHHVQAPASPMSLPSLRRAPMAITSAMRPIAAARLRHYAGAMT